MPRASRQDPPTPQDDGAVTFRPSRRFTKRPLQDKRRFKPGWFERVLDLLSSYAARTGHTLVPAKRREGNFGLGAMVCFLRMRYRRGQIPPERIRKLARLPGWSWDPIQDRFQRGLRLVQRFARREGHVGVPSGHREQGLDLAHWIERRRRRYHLGRLPASEIRALEAVPGWSWSGQVADLRFLEVLALVRARIDHQGHLRMAREHRVAGVDLRRWLVLQREAYHAGRLSPARARALEALPGWSWQPVQDRFEQNLELLRQFVRREGHARVPQDRHGPGSRLGLWVMSLRQRHRLGRLEPQLARRLEKLPGWTWNTRAASGSSSVR